MNEVLVASEVANKIKEEATAVKEKAEHLVSIISVDQKEAEGKLLAAQPALEEAERALLVNKITYHYVILIYSNISRLLKQQI